MPDLHRNRLANRPHKPRDPIILKYLADIGICWPDDAEEEEEEQVEEQEEEEDMLEETNNDDDDSDFQENENTESEHEPDPILEVHSAAGGGVTVSPDVDQKEGAANEMPCTISPPPLSSQPVVSPKPLTPVLVTPEPRTKSMSPPNAEVPQLADCSYLVN